MAKGHGQTRYFCSFPKFVKVLTHFDKLILCKKVGNAVNVIAIVVLIFSVIGAADFLFGNKIGVGAEFQKGFSLFGPLKFLPFVLILVLPLVIVPMAYSYRYYKKNSK